MGFFLKSRDVSWLPLGRPLEKVEGGAVWVSPHGERGCSLGEPPRRNGSPILKIFLRYRDVSWGSSFGRPLEKVPRIDLCRQKGCPGAPSQRVAPNFEFFSQVWGRFVFTRIGAPPLRKVPRIALYKRGGDQVSPTSDGSPTLELFFLKSGDAA